MLGGKRASYEQNRGRGLASGAVDPSGITADLVAKNMPRAQQAAMGTRKPPTDSVDQSAMQGMMMGEDSYETEVHGPIVNQMMPEYGVSGVERVAYEDGWVAGRCVRPDWGCGNLDGYDGQWIELLGE